MIGTIGPRLGLDPEETELLKFLVEQHLLLAETALKRDLMDEKPILRCSFEVGSRECLRLLYLLTIADSRATGPGAWSTWKASLLRELYDKVDHLLRRGDWKKEEVERRSAEVQEAVLAAEPGRDLLVSARTGSGKTVAFGLAMAHELLGEAERVERGAAPLALFMQGEPKVVEGLREVGAQRQGVAPGLDRTGGIALLLAGVAQREGHGGRVVRLRRRLRRLGRCVGLVPT